MAVCWVCFAFNDCLDTKKGNDPAYLQLVSDFMHDQFVYGQLCFYKPAPTQIELAKTDHPLRPGVFLDYYVKPDGKFSGQYIVCDLESFANKNLHHRIGPTHFKLSLHRTEVVRNPIGADEPVFPLRERYWNHNYTLEGIEKKDATTRPGPQFADYSAFSNHLSMKL